MTDANADDFELSDDQLEQAAGGSLKTGRKAITDPPEFTTMPVLPIGGPICTLPVEPVLLPPEEAQL